MICEAKNDELESLEMRIKQAWLTLCTFARASTSATLYLTRGGAIWGFSHNRGNRLPKGSRVIGTYTKAVLLADLRDDVFHVYREQKGRG